jgi:hypothetical protein
MTYDFQFEQFMDMPQRVLEEPGRPQDMTALWQAADPVKLGIAQYESIGEKNLDPASREELTELRAELAERRDREAER